MTIKSVVVSILCIMIAGCASFPPVEDNQGNVIKRMIIKDGYVTGYVLQEK